MDVFQIIHLGIKNFIKQMEGNQITRNFVNWQKVMFAMDIKKTGLIFLLGVHRLLKRLTSKLTGNALIKQNPSDQEALQPVIDALKQEREIGLQKFYTELNGKKASSNGELPDDVQAMRNAPPVIQSAMAPDGRPLRRKS